VELELKARPPFDGGSLLAFLGARAVPGIEEVAGSVYRRTLRLAGGPATIELRARAGTVHARFELADAADAAEAEAAVCALLDLDADPAAIAAVLGHDELLGPLVRANPGARVPGQVDAAELAIRAVIGQQVSVAGARTVAARLVAEHGEQLPAPAGGLTHVFPSPAALAELRPYELPMPRSRGRALIGLAAALASGDLVLERGGDSQATRPRLLALPGIGPWTASYIEMRALGDRDAFLPTDLGVRRALERLGLDGSPNGAEATAERWRPYRAYALQYLWTTLN
jgi:AraC family transcriptional regulator of adaptative response / DNA-3-methyladenine glycosylase II